MAKKADQSALRARLEGQLAALDQLIELARSNMRTIDAMISEEIDNPQERMEGVEDTMPQLMRELEAELAPLQALAAQAMGSKSAGGREVKGNDPAEYARRITDAAQKLEDMRDEAERTVESEASPTAVRAVLLQAMDDAGKLQFQIPVKDYDANEIPDGYALSQEVSQFIIWLDEQYSRFQINSANGRGAHLVYA